jgi:hypothetical protein
MLTHANLYDISPSQHSSSFSFSPDVDGVDSLY